MSDPTAETPTGVIPPGLRVVATRADGEPAASLLAAMSDELNELYAKLDGDLDSIPAPADQMAPPKGSFLVVFGSPSQGAAGQSEELPLACGGLKELEPGLGEVKRMYVVPEARGRGLGRLVLEQLENEARRIGFKRIRLDTGARQPEAFAIYSDAGYAEIPDYNGNPYASHWFERTL